MTTPQSYAAPGTPDAKSELASLYQSLSDWRQNTKARAQSALAPHIQIPNHSKK